MEETRPGDGMREQLLLPEGVLATETIVYAATIMVRTAHPSLALARELAAFERPEDGWPYTFLLALPGE
jgi:hypothetical protein